MGESSQEVIAQQEVENELVKRSEMCIGWNSAKLPNNTVTGVTIVTTQLVGNATLKKTQLVTNIALKRWHKIYSSYIIIYYRDVLTK